MILVSSEKNTASVESLCVMSARRPKHYSVASNARLSSSTRSCDIARQAICATHLRAIASRRFAYALTEDGREMRLRAKAGRERDVDNAALRACQQRTCLFNTPLQQILVWPQAR